MNEVEWIKSLDRGNDAPMNVDVAARVMQNLYASRQRDGERVFGFAAIVAVALAAASLALVLPTWLTPENPFAGFDDAVRLVLQ